jgi:Cdc6-like AAA superfamily ATPase
MSNTSPDLPIDDLFGGDFIPASEEDWDLLDAMAQEIFRPTAPIDEGRLFAGRIKQIRQILDVIYQPGAHGIIYGERGVGKTSLANILDKKIIRADTSTKVLKISCSPNNDFATIWGNVFFDFEYEGRPVVDVIRQNPQPFAIYKVAQGLPKSTKYLVILDEFDRLTDDQAKMLIADTIKYLSDNPVGVTVLVVGVGSSIESLFGSHPSIQRCCEQVEMPRMSPEELMQILSERLPKLHMRADQGTLEKMIQFSQGLPGYTHLLGLLSVRRAISQRTKTVTHNHLQYAITNALEKGDESTRREYYEAVQSTKPDNKYKEVLLACALTTKNERGQFSASAVCEPYSHIVGREVGIESFARHLNAFCEKDRGPALIKSGKPKGFMYQFRNPLLEPLVIMLGKKMEGGDLDF